MSTGLIVSRALGNCYNEARTPHSYGPEANTDRWTGCRSAVTKFLRVLVVALALAVIGASAQSATTLAEEAEAISRVEAYLNDIDTLRAGFVQIAPDGAVSEGTLYIQRPGQLRIDYTPPPNVKIIGTDGWLTYIDSDLGQISQMPLGDSPASVFVAENIRFGEDVLVTGVERAASILRVTLEKAGRPGLGSLTLVFTDNPLDLRQWIVVDAQGYVTRITLVGTQLGVALDPELFDTPATFPTGEGR